MLVFFNEMSLGGRIMTDETTAPERTVFYLHRDSRGRFILLGYYLDLTSREYDILNFIFESHPAPCQRRDIAAAVEGLSSDSVAVFVNLINKKSHAIGGRKLILSRRGAGYYLNEFM